jgi:glycosyltransferase involved in cell wall biosynthesis
MDETPSTISLITVLLNSASTLRDNLESVCRQSAPVEHILIDGGSTDSSLDIAYQYPHISQIISEPDSGMYDAMNKGIGLACGNVVGFLNADDFYYSPDIIEKIIQIFHQSEIDSCYGDLVYLQNISGMRSRKHQMNVSGNDDDRSNGFLATKDRFKVVRYWRSGNFDLKKFYHGWMPPHPTFFARRSVYEKYGGFNLNLGTAADYEMMLRFLLKYRISTIYLPEIITCMRVGGASNASLANRLRANFNDRKAWRINGLKPYSWTLVMKPLRKIPQYRIKSRLKL